MLEIFSQKWALSADTNFFIKMTENFRYPDNIFFIKGTCHHRQACQLEKPINFYYYNGELLSFKMIVLDIHTVCSCQHD